MKKYLLVMKLALETELEYRMNFFVSLPGLFVPIIVNSFFWVAVYANSSDSRLYGLTMQEMIVYIVVSNLIYFFISAKFTKDIAGDIRSGTLSNYVVKPVSYIFYQFFKHMGAKIVSYVMFVVFAGAFFLFAAANNVMDLSFRRFVLF
ncbi:MAG: ABC-2 family transporter protein, partial [Oscillospiraceae bacterium]|nr:ABC-2 family transporter protein [Oscillospiraceae bacterium]